MSDKIDMSLEDIIKSVKKRGGGLSASRQRRGTFRGTQRAGGGIQRGRNRGGTQRPYTRGDVNAAWKRTIDEARNSVSTVRRIPGSSHTKLLVSNLDFGVIDSDMQELFAVFGRLKNVTVHYDQFGKSLGTADVIFERKADAIRAMKRYSGVPLDGRPMDIKMATTDITSILRGGKMDGGQDRKFIRSEQRTRRPGEKGRPDGSNGRRKHSRGGKQSKQKSPTAEELDAELDAYTNGREN